MRQVFFWGKLLPVLFYLANAPPEGIIGSAGKTDIQKGSG